MIYDGTIIASRFLEKAAFSRNAKTVSRRRPKQVLHLDMTAEGLFKLGKRTGHELKFTGFNLWDRVLPPEEIKQMANSFTKGTGTVKNLV